MAKFIKFPIVKDSAAQPLGPSYDVLINIEDIAKIAATGNTGQNAKTLVVSYKQSAIGTPDATNPKTATFAVHADTDGSVNPTPPRDNACVSSTFSNFEALQHDSL